MPKIIEGEKHYILDERVKIIFALKARGYTDADIARVFFNVNRSVITRIMSHNVDAYKKFVLNGG